MAGIGVGAPADTGGLDSLLFAAVEHLETALEGIDIRRLGAVGQDKDLRAVRIFFVRRQPDWLIQCLTFLRRAVR